MYAHNQKSKTFQFSFVKMFVFRGYVYFKSSVKFDLRFIRNFPNVQLTEQNYTSSQ